MLELVDVLHNITLLIALDRQLFRPKRFLGDGLTLHTNRSFVLVLRAGRYANYSMR